MISLGLPQWLSSKESACQCRRCGFSPWVRKILWRRKWQPTPVSLPGKCHGQRSLEGYSPWGRKESDTNEQLTLLFVILGQEKNSKAMPYFTERKRFYTVFVRNKAEVQLVLGIAGQNDFWKREELFMQF